MDATENTLKEAATNFLRLASSGKVDEAYKSYVAQDFKHHNPYYKGDRESLKKGMEENSKSSPNKEFTIFRTLRDGDLVAVHSRVIQESAPLPISVVHIFRFQGKKIVELWDIIMPQPKEAINENGLF
jgi:predicted SnoaL-like aldol condensation-catalyzing enzyme